MSHKKWVVILFFLVFSLFLVSSFHPINAMTIQCNGKSCTCPQSATCHNNQCLCTQPGPDIQCGSYTPCRRDGQKCYQTRWCSNGSSNYYQIAECACPGGGGGAVPTATPMPTPTPRPCTPLPPCAINGNLNANGQLVFCQLDPLPGMTYCPRPTSSPLPTPTPPQRTCGPDADCPVGYRCYQPSSTCPRGTLCTQVIQAPYCVPTNCNPPCRVGSTCIEQAASNCPPGAYCLIRVIDPICVPNTPIPTPKNMCTLRPQGDANCDNVVNGADFDVYKTFMLGKGYTDSTYSADFNTDGKVNMIDYEIWRNTFYK